MVKRKTNSEFMIQLQEIQPTIIPLEPYKNASTRIKCRCQICGYEWPAIPNNLLRGEGCASCSKHVPWTTESFVAKMAIVNPLIQITSEYVNSKTHVEYKCLKCGKSNSALPSSLLRGHGCKNCAMENASKRHRKTNELFVEQLTIANPGVLPLEEYTSSTTPIRCRCVCGNNDWYPTPRQLLKGRKCKNCQSRRNEKQIQAKKRKLRTNEDYVSELADANPGVEAIETYTAMNNKIKFRCKKCGYEWLGWPQSALKGKRCSKCQKRWGTSFPEQAIFFYVALFFPDAVNTYKEGFGKSELDIFIPSKMIGIEYDGGIWHKDKYLKEQYKYHICKTKGIKLIRIRETELKEDPSLICDHFIMSEYGEKNHFSNIDKFIRELLAYLEIVCNVDTEKNKIRIMEQYYGALHDKSFGALFPEIAQEWYQPKNGELTPFMIPPKSHESFWWKCPDCGRVYQAVVSSRASGHGCRYCKGTPRKKLSEFITEMEEINPTIEITGEYINAYTPIEFRCKKCGGYNYAEPRVLRRGAGCKKCNNEKARIERTFPEDVFLERVYKEYPYIEVIGKYVNSRERIRCKCLRCNREWMPIAESLLTGNAGCIKCSGRAKKAVRCIETGEEFESVNQVERIKGICHSTISLCCNKKANTAGGFHWEFVEKKE